MTSLSSSTSLLARQAAIKSHRWLSPKHPLATSLRSHQRSSVTTATATVHGGSSSSTHQAAYKNTNMAAAALLLAAASTVAVSSWMVDAPTAAMETLPSSPDIIAAVVKEKSTGITFPQLCNGLSLVGCGVRIKWGFVKVCMYVWMYVYACMVRMISFCDFGSKASMLFHVYSFHLLARW